MCWSVIGCANEQCKELTVDVSLLKDRSINSSYEVYGSALISHRLYPRGTAKPQPDYIPLALREDYEEACLVRDLSPKAAATLARRCLQGMIRDFCGIKKKRLVDEINALRAAVEDRTAPHGVSLESVDAIDHVRTVGNIGAHMEADVDLIIPVESDEAQLLIELIENLFDDWYVERQVRQDRFAAIQRVAAGKKALIADARNSKALAAPEQYTEGD